MQVVTQHYRPLLLGTLAALATFALFYIMTVWSLGWGVNKLGYPRPQFLIFQILGAVCFAGTIFISGLWADRIGRRFVLSLSAVLVIAFGLALPHLFVSGHPVLTCLMICLGLSVMGLTYGPLGTDPGRSLPHGRPLHRRLPQFQRRRHPRGEPHAHDRHESRRIPWALRRGALSGGGRGDHPGGDPDIAKNPGNRQQDLTGV